jgi:hypothetical protein
MRIYTIHLPRRPWRSISVAVAGARAVKDGFSWPAFFFSFLWALTQRLWAPAAVLLAAELAVGAATEVLDPITAFSLSLGAMLIVGWIGNDLKRRDLARQGFGERGVVLAATGEDAVRRYFADTGPRDGYAEGAR